MKYRRILLIVLFAFFFQDAYPARFIPESDLIKRVLTIVDQLYVDKNRIDPENMLHGALDRLSGTIAPVLTQIDIQAGITLIDIRVDQSHQSFRFNTPKTTAELNDILQQIVRFVKTHLETDEKLQSVDYAVINGFLSRLDPHSSLLIPEIYSDFSTSTSGNFGGVGMMIGIREGALTIIAPIDNTPASRAGLKAKDRIVQINEESTVNMSLTDAVQKLRGDKDTKVDVYIMRPGFTSPKKFTLIRDIIEITSVESHQFADDGKRVGYLKINTFQQNTTDEINSHLEGLDYDLNDFYGLILDLRNNPGGLLEQAIKVSDRFLNSGIIVSTAGLTQDSTKRFKARWFRSLVDIPIIVLVNNGSASAAEIVAAALKKNDRAVVMGIQTFGKGSVQQVIPFQDGSALRLTTSKYLTPDNTSIQSVGVTPHIALTPYFITDEFLQVTEPSSENGEKTLDQNYAEWGDQAEAAEKTIFFLYDEKETTSDDVDPDEETDTRVLRQQQLENDFLVQTAHTILQKNNRNGFGNLHQTSLEHAALVEQQQEQTIIDRFNAIPAAIDWKRYESLSPGKLEARVWLETQSEEGLWEPYQGDIVADQEIRLYVEARNVGTTRIARLLAITECENNVFNERQFAFGKLETGDAKSWFIPIKISEAAPSRNDLIQFNFIDQEQTIIHQAVFAMIVKEKPRPRFFYRITTRDDIAPAQGNGNASIEPGETILIELEIANRGEGVSGPLTVLLRSGEGNRVFLKKGRQTIDALKPDELQTAFFLFDFLNLPEDGDLDFALDIIDGTFQMSSLNHRLKLPLKRKIAPITNLPPAISITPRQLLSRSPEFDLIATIEDDKGIKDIYVFLNQKKIHYQNYLKTPQRQTIPFSIRLNLNDDMNHIMIVARDDNNVTVQKNLYLRYGNAKSLQ
jgi:carboxyl-terminal processing protease